MSEHNNKAKRNGEDTESTKFVNVADTIKTLKGGMLRKGFLIVPDINGKYSKHRVYQSTNLTFNKAVRIWKELDKTSRASFDAALNEFMEVNLQDLEEHDKASMCKVYECLTTKVATSSNNPLWSHGILNSDGQDKTRSCTGQMAYSQVPKKEWFPHLSELNPLELLTLLPEPEAKLLMLLLGRTVYGNENVKLTEGNVNHHMRTAAVIVGLEHGLGKSLLMSYILSALSELGYTTETIGNPGARFGWGEIGNADLAFKDDMNAKNQEALLGNETVKTIVTGGLFNSERKGQDSISSTATCTVIACSNNYSKNQFIGLDEGTLSRFRFLYTYNREELAEKYGSVEAGMTEYKWLALSDQYKCTIQDLACYLLACSAEYFLDECGHAIVHQQVISIKPTTLEATTNNLTSQLYYQTDLKHVQNLVLSTARLLAMSAVKARMSDAKKQTWLVSLKSANFGWELLGEAMSAYVASSHKCSAHYVIKLDSNCYNAISKNVERWSNVGNKRTAPVAFETMVAELISVDNYRFPKSSSYYASHWTEASKKVEAFMLEYSEVDFDTLSDTLNDVLDRVYKIVR